MSLRKRGLRELEAERKAVEDAEKVQRKERKAMPAVIPVKEEPEVFNGDEMLIKRQGKLPASFQKRNTAKSSR